MCSGSCRRYTITTLQHSQGGQPAALAFGRHRRPCRRRLRRDVRCSVLRYHRQGHSSLRLSQRNRCPKRRARQLSARRQWCCRIKTSPTVHHRPVRQSAWHSPWRPPLGCLWCCPWKRSKPKRFWGLHPQSRCSRASRLLVPPSRLPRQLPPRGRPESYVTHDDVRRLEPGLIKIKYIIEVSIVFCLD